MSNRGFHGSPGGRRPETNSLCALVARQTELVTGSFGLFRDCFEGHDLRGARPAFARFHDALRRFGRWEERALLAEAVRRGLVGATQIRIHERQHASLEALAGAIERALAEYTVTQSSLRSLSRVVDRLEALLMTHDASELHEVCCLLGRIVDDADVARLESAAVS